MLTTNAPTLMPLLLPPINQWSINTSLSQSCMHHKAQVASSSQPFDAILGTAILEMMYLTTMLKTCPPWCTASFMSVRYFFLLAIPSKAVSNCWYYLVMDAITGNHLLPPFKLMRKVCIHQSWLKAAPVCSHQSWLEAAPVFCLVPPNFSLVYLPPPLDKLYTCVTWLE